MKYNFKDILNETVYSSTRVILLTGNHNIFINIVADILKEQSIENSAPNINSIGLAEEFGLDDSDSTVSTSVDINTFFEVANVSNINGKWYCKVSLDSLNKKQKEQVIEYAKNPSRHAILVLTSTDFREFKEFLKNKAFLFGQYTHLMQLSFPNKPVLKNILIQMFEEKGKEIDSQSADYFMMRLNTEYDEYERVINEIVEKHKESKIEFKDMKAYLKSVEYFDIDDFLKEVVKPLSSDKLGNKKIIRMLSSLRDKYDSELLTKKLIDKIEELIEFRTLINSGYISINIRYIFNDVIKAIGNEHKFAKMNEWVFRNKADLASMTSLEDWVYMWLILSKAMGTGFPDSKQRKVACERALYNIATRSVLCESRLNNIIGVDNVLNNNITRLNRIKYKEVSSYDNI